MKPRYLIISIISLLMTAACSTETGRQLRHADSVMEEQPDSAMSILKDIDRQSIKTSDLPYYALLFTQAQIKTDIPLTSDSLISIAYAKYGADTRGDRGIRSNFYTAEVFFNQDKYRDAMPFYLTAYEESKRLRNDYWHAKAAERISDLFFFAYNYDEAELYAKEAVNKFNCAGRLLNHRYSLAQLANILLNNGLAERAYTILDSLKFLAKEEHPIDSAFLDYIRYPLVDAKFKTGRNDEIEFDEISIHKGMSDNEKIDAVVLESKVSNQNGNSLESLNEMMAFAHSNEDRIHLLYARYKDAKAIGKSVLAFSLVDSMLFYQNAVAEDIIKESVTAAQRDFYSRMAVRHDEHSRFLKWILILGALIFLLVLAGVVVFFILRGRTKNAELQAQLEAFLSLKTQSDWIHSNSLSIKEVMRQIGYQKESMANQIQELQNVNTEHNEIIEKLFKEKWVTLDRLCDQYHGLDNSELNAKDLVANMQKEVKKVVSKKGLKQIVDAVDLYMGGIVTSLRTQCPFLKEADVNFLALLYAGFTTRAVCMFIDIKYEYFYVKKSRLIKRIEASDAPDKALFLQKLR